MRRLVDIDEVIKVAENVFPQEDVRKIIWVLCYTPTAYSVEKVVEELEQLKNTGSVTKTEMLITKACVNKAIEIVKKGGVK